MAFRQPRWKKIFKVVLWLWVTSIAGLLLFCYALPQDLSRTTRLYTWLVTISFFGRVLTVQLGLLLIPPALAALVLRHFRLALFSALLTCVALYPTLSGFLPRHPPAVSGPILRIMSMNLKYTQANAPLIADQISQVNPDLIAIEDITPFSRQLVDQQFGRKYPHHAFLINALQGMAIYSRFPFIGRPATSFTRTRRQMRAVIIFHERPLAIYVEHPYSPRTVFRIIDNRLATLDLAAQLTHDPLPAIVAGDFNFTDTTPNQTTLKAVGLEDCFTLAGHGCGFTWPMQPPWIQHLPGVRIDHIFITPTLTCTAFTTGTHTGSDHLPIIADIAFR